MNPWFAKVAILVATVAMVAIRAPHGRLSRTIKVIESRKGSLEIFLLAVASIAFLIPILWIATPWFAFADYRLYLKPLLTGSLLLALGLWLFYRSHSDLGTNWSVTLEIREAHGLVTDGVYRRVRHPMYAALLLYGLGQAIVVPNWVAGPVYAVAMVLICAFRLGREEALMREHFKSAYDAYASRTKRLIPGVW